MNIFFVDTNPETAAQSLVNSHVVKMILESAQMLSTAHRILDGTMYIELSPTGRKIKRWKLPDGRDSVLYSATHIHHPSSVWVRQSSGNYSWLYRHFNYLLIEYNHRYGKIHKSAELAFPLLEAPHNIPKGSLTDPPCAMDPKYIISACPVENYRNYYRLGKAHLHQWKVRPQPYWI